MRIVKKIIKFLIVKIKWRSKVRFSWSANIDLDSEFEGMNQIHPHSNFKGYLGYGSYIASNSGINAKIGRFTSIGPWVNCSFGTHPYTYPFVTTAPCFYSLNPHHSQNGNTFATEQCFNEFLFRDHEKKYALEIGNDCWIGEGAFLVGGIKISDGAMILAHAVVTKDVPPYAIVGGVPARIIGYRYSESDINFLLQVRWWDKSPDWFKENWRLLDNFENFKTYFNETKEENTNNFLE